MKSQNTFLIPAGLTSAKVIKKRRKLGRKLLRIVSKHRLLLVVTAHGLVIAALGFGTFMGSGQADTLNSLAEKIVSSNDTAATVDQISSTELAGQIAKLSSIVEANSVVNQADSLNVQVDFGRMLNC